MNAALGEERGGGASWPTAMGSDGRVGATEGPRERWQPAKLPLFSFSAVELP